MVQGNAARNLLPAIIIQRETNFVWGCTPIPGPARSMQERYIQELILSSSDHSAFLSSLKTKSTPGAWVNAGLLDQLFLALQWSIIPYMKSVWGNAITKWNHVPPGGVTGGGFGDASRTWPYGVGSKGDFASSSNFSNWPTAETLYRLKLFFWRQSNGRPQPYSSQCPIRR